MKVGADQVDGKPYGLKICGTGSAQILYRYFIRLPLKWGGAARLKDHALEIFMFATFGENLEPKPEKL